VDKAAVEALDIEFRSRRVSVHDDGRQAAGLTCGGRSGSAIELAARKARNCVDSQVCGQIFCIAPTTSDRLDAN